MRKMRCCANVFGISRAWLFWLQCWTPPDSCIWDDTTSMVATGMQGLYPTIPAVASIHFRHSIGYRMSSQGGVDSRAVACKEEGTQGVFMQPRCTHVGEPWLMAVQLIFLHHPV